MYCRLAGLIQLLQDCKTAKCLGKSRPYLAGGNKLQIGWIAATPARLQDCKIATAVFGVILRGVQLPRYCILEFPGNLAVLRSCESCTPARLHSRLPWKSCGLAVLRELQFPQDYSEDYCSNLAVLQSCGSCPPARLL